MRDSELYIVNEVYYRLAPGGTGVPRLYLNRLFSVHLVLWVMCREQHISSLHLCLELRYDILRTQTRPKVHTNATVHGQEQEGVLLSGSRARALRMLTLSRGH